VGRCGLEVDRAGELGLHLPASGAEAEQLVCEAACTRLILVHRERELAVARFAGLGKGMRQLGAGMDRHHPVTSSLCERDRVAAAHGDLDRRRFSGEREDARVVDAVVLALVRVVATAPTARG